MNRKRSAVVFIFVLLIGLLVLLYWRSGKRAIPIASPATTTTAVPAPNRAPAAMSTQSATPMQVSDIPGRKLTDQDKLNIGKIAQAFSASIVFYGKVEDQFGAQVPDASIEYSVANRYFGESTRVDGGKSDEQGLFSKFGMAGAGVYVSVFKEGYYGNGSKSARSFGYGTPSGEPPPSKEHPALFVLHKMGPTEPLVKLETGSVVVPQDGTPYKLGLRRERGRLLPGMPNGDLQVELWSDYKSPPPHGRIYDWRCRISVPGGGLVERVGGFDFEAPAENYVPVFEFNMPDTSERWQPALKKEIFLRLTDGCFARVTLHVITGEDHFVEIESYLNPTPGSRNLEFDPAKEIKPKP